MWLTSRPTDGRLTAFLIDDRYRTLCRHAYPILGLHLRPPSHDHESTAAPQPSRSSERAASFVLEIAPPSRSLRTNPPASFSASHSLNARSRVCNRRWVPGTASRSRSTCRDQQLPGNSSYPLADCCFLGIISAEEITATLLLFYELALARIFNRPTTEVTPEGKGIDHHRGSSNL